MRRGSAWKNAPRKTRSVRGVPQGAFLLEQAHQGRPPPVASQSADLLRLAARAGDASDATVAVLQRQLGNDPGPISWHRLGAAAPPEAVVAAAIHLLPEPQSL